MDRPRRTDVCSLRAQVYGNRIQVLAVLSSVLLGGALFWNAYIARQATDDANRRQREYLDQQTVIARQQVFDKVVAASEKIIDDDSWFNFTTFTLGLDSVTRGKVLAQMDDKDTRVPSNIAAVIGEPKSERRRIFMKEWWRVASTIWTQARVLHEDRVVLQQLMDVNGGVFGTGNDPDPEGPLFDRFMVDCKRINVVDNNMIEFRTKWQAYYGVGKSK